MANLNELQVFLRGGLGNQLYQYSTGLAISEQYGKKLVLRTDLLPKTQDQIGGISRWPDQISSFAHSGVLRGTSYQPIGKTNLFGKSMQIMRTVGDRWPVLSEKMGWYASEKSAKNEFFNPAGTRLINSYVAIKDFAWKNQARLRLETSQIRNPSNLFSQLMEEMADIPTCVIHVRLGDYRELARVYGQSSDNFIQAAIGRIRSYDMLERVWVFSDSPKDLMLREFKNLTIERVIGPDDLPRPIENLVLMSKANSIIASNSSFSWWAGCLSREGTRVVAPYYSSALVNNFSKSEMRILNWELIDV
jgi:hypothetical protein